MDSKVKEAIAYFTGNAVLWCDNSLRHRDALITAAQSAEVLAGALEDITGYGGEASARARYALAAFREDNQGVL